MPNSSDHMPENALQADNKDVRLGHDHWVLAVR